MKTFKIITAALIVTALSLSLGEPAYASKLRSTITSTTSESASSTVQTSQNVTINPAFVDKPHELASKGDVKNVGQIVDSIERIIDKTLMSCKAFDGNEEIFVSANGDARVVKCQFDSEETVPLCQELDKHMKSYGYKEYALDVYYDNPEAGEEPINDGPICITGTIGGDSYTYYFSNDTLIRRVTGDTKSDNIKTNDFLNKIYKIVWKYQNISLDPESLSVTDVLWTGKTGKITTDTTLTACLEKDYNNLKKVLGPNKYYQKEKESLEEFPFWFYVLDYDNVSVLLHSENDKVFCLYSTAEQFWQIPKEGMNIYEFIERTNAEINDIFIEECNGDLYLGSVGDTEISLIIGDSLYTIIVYNGLIYPDSDVEVWKIQ